MRTGGVVLLLIASCTLGFPKPAIGGSYSETLANIVQQHRSGAPNAEHELRLVADLQQLSAAHPAEWLPEFWAAYFMTQVVMRHKQSRVERLDRAQQLLDQATKKASAQGEYPIADVLSLQSLIYSFRRGAVDNDEQALELEKKIDTVKTQAFETDPYSPVVMVIAATDVIREGQKRRSWSEIMAGHALLRDARDRFSKVDNPRGLTTHFNSEWVTPWMNWVERMYENGLDAE